MLLPDNVHPELSIYYNGAFLLQELQMKNEQKLLELYQNVKSKHSITFPLFVLCLDWLYLIEVAQLNDHGVIELCT